MRAGKSIIFCASQRTGSTLVFDDLRNVLGYEPGNSEILYDRIVRDRKVRTTEPPWSEVWADVSEVNRVEGYFVDKVMFHYTAWISSYIDRSTAKDLRRTAKFSPELFDDFYIFFADAIWVYIERRNVFAQAVSMYVAEATQIWERRIGQPSQNGTYASAIGYDFSKIRPYLQEFLFEREQWQLFFGHYNITPIRISYEDAATNYPQYLMELLDRAELKMVEDPPQRRLVKLGDQANETMAELLRNDVIADLYSERHART